jgi:hypothetical protein
VNRQFAVPATLAIAALVPVVGAFLIDIAHAIVISGFAGVVPTLRWRPASRPPRRSFPGAARRPDLRSPTPARGRVKEVRHDARLFPRLENARADVSGSSARPGTG